MTMEELYQAMKDSLKYLNLRFSDMHEVDVCLNDGFLVFSHENRQTSIEIVESKDV